VAQDEVPVIFNCGPDKGLLYFSRFNKHSVCLITYLTRSLNLKVRSKHHLSIKRSLIMKKTLFTTLALITATNISLVAGAENLQHTQQLLSTKKCPQCDLSGAGLIMINLSGADLTGANLTGANLSRSNLTGANLTGANLSGATLFGANLTGANLTGANVTGTDFRSSYLANVNFKDVSLNKSYLQGAIGIPNQASSPEQLYELGLLAAQKQDHKTAIDYFNQSLSMNPKFALGYLGRGVSRYRLGDERGAMQDGTISSYLFTQENNKNGYQLAESFLQGIDEARNPQAQKKGGGGFLNFLGSVGSLLFQFMKF
jgi:Pentapeptide repeats (8 copies)